jgi:ubiquinone/menaquinone biosynthesis C-methylase UbiE
MSQQNGIIEAFTEMAPRYAQVVDSELSRFWGWSYEGFVDRLVNSLPIRENETILDVATGTGSVPMRLNNLGISHPRIHGLDITFAMLMHAQRRLAGPSGQEAPNLVCASAMVMPYGKASFSHVICGLATHHLNVQDFVSESFRVLHEGGMLSIADAGGSIFWKIPGVKFLIRIAAFIYFAIVESKTRAWAELSAVSNVRSKEDWRTLLSDYGFENIRIENLKSKYFFIPSPLMIQAQKKIGAVGNE